MVKLVALYKKPKDTEVFDKHYEEVHTPLTLKMPGLRKMEVSRVTGAPMGESEFYLMAEMYFDDAGALQAAMGSDEGKAAARDLMGFAGDIVTMFIAEVKSN